MKSVTLFVLGALLLTGTMYLTWQKYGDQRKHTPAKTPDVQQQSLFDQCVLQRDREIHLQVFETIDNPDVQREILATEKERAIRECRKQYPALPAD